MNTYRLASSMESLHLIAGMDMLCGVHSICSTPVCVWNVIDYVIYSTNAINYHISTLLLPYIYTLHIVAPLLLLSY